MEKRWWRHGHMTKLSLWDDRQNTASQSEDASKIKLL